jgi:lysophospholipase L1-like esterase
MRNNALYYVLATVVLVLALVGIDALVLAQHNPNSVLKQPHYYLALGDSLTFGYQPDLNFTDGFADKVYAQLHPASVTQEINFACAGETTTSMIQGGCIARFAHHGSYTGAQLDAALEFIRAHPGEVSPITLEIGANDILPDWQSNTCMPTATATADLATMDANLTTTILPELTQALNIGGSKLVRAGGLVMLNYYNPFAQECKNSAPFVHTFNEHLAADAAKFQVPIVDIYAAFGGDAAMATNVCAGPTDAQGVHHPYTWICTAPYFDLHPTTVGYSVMATAVEVAVGYPTGPMLPGIVPMGRSTLPLASRAHGPDSHTGDVS